MSVNYSHCLVYVTAADAEEARLIGRAMVEARLAACANVFPQMVPIFLWEGEIGEGSESVVIMKTTRERAEELIAAVEAMHSYECPCAVILPLAGGSRAFLDWISHETVPQGDA
ncbi:divalent-cation tolerance protein CutA [Pelagibius marinus]|uniref:divalent-cation tolerance protein CutA n=1 Tax=Pelagibius marinus TaxID=2762760 RepID=UPI001872A3CD|nr:divalent-cation tolerance protein CutA [Pelagibius marinus]